MSTNRSALPWKIGSDHFVYDSEGHFVCVSGFHHTVAGGDYIPSKLNTAFIIKAVNCHDQLVEALIWARSTLGNSSLCAKACDAALTAAGTK